MKIVKHLYQDREGYMYTSPEVAKYWTKTRANNRMKWLLKQYRSKYTPHQGERECRRRLNSI